MERYKQDEDEVSPSKVVATLDDYDRDREMDRLRVQRILGNLSDDEDTQDDPGVTDNVPFSGLQSERSQTEKQEKDIPENDLRKFMDSLKIQSSSKDTNLPGESMPARKTTTNSASLNTQSQQNSQSGQNKQSEESAQSEENEQSRNTRRETRGRTKSRQSSSQKSVKPQSPSSQHLDMVAMEMSEDLWETNSKYQCRTAMELYSCKSLEELRLEHLEFMKWRPVFPKVQKSLEQKHTGRYTSLDPPSGQDTFVRNGFTQTINTKHQCITAMREYEDKSLEEIRLEDYKLKQHRMGSTCMIQNGFGQMNAWNYTSFDPPSGREEEVRNGINQMIDTRHQCISAMEKYSDESLEELRLADYLNLGIIKYRLVDHIIPVTRHALPLPAQHENLDWIFGGTPNTGCDFKGHGGQLRMYHKSAIMDPEVTRLLSRRQIGTLVDNRYNVEGYCVRDTSQIIVSGYSKGEVNSALQCALSKIESCKTGGMAERVNICIDYLYGNCFGDPCKLIHLPYLWQIRLFSSTWISLVEQERIEKAFCDNKYTYVAPPYQMVEHMGIRLNVISVSFNPEMKAEVQLNGSSIYLDLRRLTTASYVEVPNSPLKGYWTQWRWYWRDSTGWTLYQPGKLQHTLEEKFMSGQREYHFFNGEGSRLYKIKFDKMCQTNVETRTKRAIRRRPIFVSNDMVQKREIPENPCSIHLDQALRPPLWSSLDHAFPFELVRLQFGSQEYENIEDGFFKTIDSGKWWIHSIYRLQNSVLWTSFYTHERLMLDKAKRAGLSGVNKMQLYHGTDSLDAVYGICVNNFDFRLSGKNATAFGHGAYFAKNASYSHGYTLKKEDRSRSNDADQLSRYMFVASVLVGEYTKGNPSYRRPPSKQGNAHILFDSCVDKDDDPGIFIIFDKQQYYPEYLIEYYNIPLETEEDKM